MKIYMYSGTHWDREWYNTFQGFRKMLVDMADDLIEGLENTPDYGIFHFDGQTIVLEDYLAIRPEMKERLTSLIQKGKIIIGPWYTMPDEFLISGESMIRNLQKGMEISREFGVEPSHNAYICDIFGHSSQTPQIFKGLDLNHTVLGRGTNRHEEPTHFRWAALDGTEVVVFRLKDEGGYGDFITLGADLSSENIKEVLKKYVDAEIERSEFPLVVIMDGQDHQGMRKDTGKYLELLQQLYPDAEICHVSIDEMNKEQDRYFDQMKVVKGELCRPTKVRGGYGHTITNTLSSRYPLKKYNDQNQTYLEKWASPLYAYRKTDMADNYLKTAIRHLLQNQCHDSICGCSIDQVHTDMMYRFDQTKLICDEIVAPFKDSLAETEGEAQPGKRIRIYNPLPYKAKRNVTAILHFKDLPTYAEPFGYERIPAFELYDAAGNQIPYGFVRPLPGMRYEIAFETELTPTAITEIEVRPCDYPTRNPARLLRSVRSAESDKLRISINLDGTVDLYDKENDELYPNLLTMVDDGEIGDGWFHCNPNIDKIVSPTTADVQVIENSPVRVTFRIVQKMALPAKVDRSCGILRSEDTVDYRICHDVTLAKGDNGIHVHTTIQNNAEDHRLRLRLPATVEGSHYEAAQAFGYVKRRCGDDPTTANWKEYAWVERNMAHICAKRAGKRGLAFISAYGLHECGVWDNGDMDITLMRCFSKTAGTSGEPGGQLLGKLEFDFRIQPFTDTDRFSALQKEQDFMATGLYTLTVNSGGKAQTYRPTLALEGEDILFSTANKVGSESEVRIYNDSPDAQAVKLSLPDFAKKASLTEIDGRHIEALEVSDGTVRFDLPGFRIATVRFS